MDRLDLAIGLVDDVRQLLTQVRHGVEGNSVCDFFYAVLIRYAPSLAFALMKCTPEVVGCKPSLTR
ncbi:hypothetical protein BST27_11410 [Mycobacterium intermedium]|uniref:Uncharacterized protein n=1 Tax=Mycobacterium intermedium TaxID=28445 RepID=A0A1T3WBH6_MYCIE|nr:hypothetical protein BV508_05465 [Mycobacterium intermedium]ORB06101.1 hypothetical protein BST27_11410 [Mycobacterium intermedium]